MKGLLGKIIFRVLTGQDYREHVLATINKRFIDKIDELVSEIFRYKAKGGDWLKRLLQDVYEKRGTEYRWRLLWYSGLNRKTVKNMAGTDRKDVCLELGKMNIDLFRTLVGERTGTDLTQIRIKLKKGKEEVELDEEESFLFINIMAVMKFTVQGGAWSEVGKITEKALLYTMFTLLKLPEEDYILDSEEMKRRGLASSREIDGIVFDKSKKPMTIEIKLLGIGNPEIGDEALARKVGLFLIDMLTEMMKREAAKIGTKVIEFRQKDALKELYDFFKSKSIRVSSPGKMTHKELEAKISKILQTWTGEGKQLTLE